MRTNGRTLIIMPAWNESAVIGGTIQELRASWPEMDLLVVDDGSADGTADIARDAGAMVLRLPYNLGVGGAMRAGYKFALRHGYGRAIQVDADGQHDPVGIGLVLDGLEHSDISIGARFAEVGTYEVRGPRRWAMKVLAMVLSRIARTRLTDVTSGFRAANSRAIEQYSRYYPAEYLGDTLDSLIMAARSGLTVQQVAVRMRPRQGGTPSNNPARSAIYLFRSMFALLIALTRRRTVREG